jgi:hypothetical protein
MGARGLARPQGRSAGRWKHEQRRASAGGQHSGVRVYGHVVVVPFEDLADDFRSHYQAKYAANGMTYEDFDPAYRYGHALASETRFDGRDWDEIETEARAEWARRYPQDGWERFKSAVRHAWGTRHTAVSGGSARGSFMRSTRNCPTDQAPPHQINLIAARMKRLPLDLVYCLESQRALFRIL